MKKLDKLKRQRYELEMKVIRMESSQQGKKRSKKEENELEILRKKLADLDSRIENIH